MDANIRPLTLGEILDRTVQLYRSKFLLFTGIAAPAAGVLILVSGSFGVFLTSRFLNLAQTSQNGGTPPPPQVASQEALILMALLGVFFVVGVPLLLGAFSMALAALSFAATKLERGESITIRSAYGYAFGNFWRHVGILFLQALFAWVIPYFIFAFILFVGAMLAAFAAGAGASKTVAPLLIVGMVLLVILMFVACVVIWLRLSLAYPASTAENATAWNSLKRSNFLTAGTRGRIFLMFLLVAVLTMTVSAALTVPLDMLIFFYKGKSGFPMNPVGPVFTLIQIANLGVSFLVRIFVMPIYSVALVLFYIDQRVRLEGFDIERLISHAGWVGSIPPPFSYSQIASVPAGPWESNAPPSFLPHPSSFPDMPVAESQHSAPTPALQEVEPGEPNSEVHGS